MSRASERGNTGGSIIRYPFSNLEFHWGYYLAAVMIGLAVGLARKKWRAGALTGYLFFVFAVTLFSRKAGKAVIRLTPFWSYKKGLTAQIKANIMLFVPIGLLAERYALLSALGTSLAVELLQLVTRRGTFDVDDIISNMIGAGIGVMIAQVGGMISKWRYL